MRTASLWLAVLTLLLFHSEPARAASTTNNQTGLRLRGTVKSLVVEQQASGSSYIVVGLRYELTNTGGHPIILWKRGSISGGPWPYTFTGLSLSRTPGFDRKMLFAKWDESALTMRYLRPVGFTDKSLRALTTLVLADVCLQRAEQQERLDRPKKKTRP